MPLATPANPTLSVRLLLPIRRALQAAGHDWVAFFGKHAIAPELFDDASGRIDHDVALRIYEDLKALAGDTFHLDAAEQVLQNDTDAFGYAARAARTGGESMERFVRYARLLHDTIANRIRVEGEFAHWELILPPDLRFSNEAGEFLIGMFLVLCRRHTGVDLRPRVLLRRARPASGDGQTVLGTALACVPGRQQPGAYSFGVLSGIFDTASAENPFKDWNMVYIPYCTGDVHFGTKKNGTVPGVTTPQQFVGYVNMQKFVGRIVPTFKDKVDRAVITGASAGSFGAALNLSMVQDAFGNDARVDALLDSGAPFSDKYMPPCMQKRWRESWGFADALPPDCTECRQADGGGMIRMADYLIKKHPNSTLAAVTSIHDEVIRLFFSVGVKNCANFDTIDPVMITMGQILDPTILYASADYEAAMQELRTTYKSTGRFSTYFMSGVNGTVHQHIFRARFTDPAAGSETIAKFVGNWLDGKFEHIGP